MSCKDIEASTAELRALQQQEEPRSMSLKIQRLLEQAGQVRKDWQSNFAKS